MKKNTGLNKNANFIFFQLTNGNLFCRVDLICKTKTREMENVTLSLLDDLIWKKLKMPRVPFVV